MDAGEATQPPVAGESDRRDRVAMALSAREQDDLLWWAEQGRPCPECGGAGVPIVIEVTDQSTSLALQHRLACLGDCCIDGLAPDRECTVCGHRF